MPQDDVIQVGTVCSYEVPASLFTKKKKNECIVEKI